MKRYIDNKKGAALVTVLLVMVVLSILGIALLNTSLSDNKLAIHEEKRVKAYYMARAGAEAASAWVENPAHTLGQINTLVSTNTTNTDDWTTFEDGQFKISFSGDKYSPVIHSVGEFNGVDQKVNLSLDKNYFFEAAVTVTDNLHMQNLNNTSVDGSVALANGATITGNGSGNIGSLINSTRTYDEPSDPGLDPATQSWPPAGNTVTNDNGYADCYYTSMNFANNTEYDFVLSDDMALQCDIMSMGGPGTVIHVSGTGILSIYTDSLDFKGKLYTDPGAKTIINVFNNGTLDLQTGGGILEAFVYGPNADMSIMANYDSLGAIVARNLDLQAGGNVTFNTDLGNVYPEDMGFDSLGYSRDEWLD